MICRNVTTNEIYINLGNNDSQDATGIQSQRFVAPLSLVEIPPDRQVFALEQLEDYLTRGILVLVDENPYDQYVWRSTIGIPDFDGAFHLIPRSALEYPEIRDHGVAIGMFPKLNFTGGGVSVANAGSGTADITIETNTVLPYTRVTGDYQAVLADLMLGCRITAPSTITLPNAPVDGQYLTVKDEDGSFLANLMTIVGFGGALIDGAASYVMGTPYQANEFVWNGDSWSIK